MSSNYSCLYSLTPSAGGYSATSRWSFTLSFLFYAMCDKNTETSLLLSLSLNIFAGPEVCFFFVFITTFANYKIFFSAAVMLMLCSNAWHLLGLLLLIFFKGFILNHASFSSWFLFGLMTCSINRIMCLMSFSLYNVHLFPRPKEGMVFYLWVWMSNSEGKGRLFPAVSHWDTIQDT